MQAHTCTHDGLDTVQLVLVVFSTVYLPPTREQILHLHSWWSSPAATCTGCVFAWSTSAFTNVYTSKFIGMHCNLIALCGCINKNVYVPYLQMHLTAADDAKLTVKSSLCLHYTPHSISSSRHCSHSNIVFSACIQSSQNGRGCRRWGGDLTAPDSTPISSVLQCILRDGHITLGSGPSHSQNWSSLSHCLEQSNTSHLGRGLQIT